VAGSTTSIGGTTAAAAAAAAAAASGKKEALPLQYTTAATPASKNTLFPSNLSANFIRSTIVCLAVASLDCSKMVRPRLVQEGTPLTDDNLNQSQGSQPSSNQRDHQLYQQTNNLAHAHAANAVNATRMSGAFNDSSSSLQRAAGNNYASNTATRKATTSYRHVIGGGNNDNQSAEQHSTIDHDMELDDHHHHQLTYHYSIDNARHNQHHNQPYNQPYNQQQQAAYNRPLHEQQYSHTTPQSHNYTHSKPPYSTSHTTTPHRTTHYEIGSDTRILEQMEGVQDLTEKSPLIVLDGANLSHSYAEAMQGGSLSTATSRRRPTLRGIQVARKYFETAHLRVRIVVPANWLAWAQSSNHEDKHLFATWLDQWRNEGILVVAPPTDDDDAYAITIARREHARAMATSSLQGSLHTASFPWSGGYVVSNDQFRDAQARDVTGQLKEWLQDDSSMMHGGGLQQQSGGTFRPGPGRISYAFCDFGVMNDRGERELDIVPNPRHPLVAWVEQHQLKHGTGSQY
jgi:Zc3h12a-like Ribonuclease NYN domain